MPGAILGALLPVIVTLALGMLAGWRRDEDTQAAESLNRMVLVYALPLALFAGTALPFVAAFLADRTLFAAPHGFG